MEFCSCGGLLVPTTKGNKKVLVCRRCGKAKTKPVKPKDFKISLPSKKTADEIIVVDKKDKFEALPKTSAQCPKCEHNEAFWWMEQTRSSDEAPTRFYKCAKCGHTWREYE